MFQQHQIKVLTKGFLHKSQQKKPCKILQLEWIVVYLCVNIWAVSTTEGQLHYAAIHYN